MRYLWMALLTAAALSPSLAMAQSPGSSQLPRIAVLDFSTRGLTSSTSWYGNSFQPGVALADLVTDALVNSGKYHVIDRTHVDSILSEHHLAQDGEVSPETAVRSGRLIGARYLIMGNVMQLEKTGESGGIGGALIGGLTGGLLSGGGSERVTLKVQIRVVDALSGEIVQSFSDEQTKKGSSFAVAGFSGAGAGAYGNSQFVNSTMGHLINDEALKIGSLIDPAKMASSASGPAIIRARIILVQGSNYILNAGSDKNITLGMTFNVFKIMNVRDPSTGKVLSTKLPEGQLSITSVSDHSAVARRLSGTIHAGAAAEYAP